MASLEFEDYANIWWEEQQAHQELHRHDPISTWEEMKDVMYERFIPDHYLQGLMLLEKQSLEVCKPRV